MFYYLFEELSGEQQFFESEDYEEASLNAAVVTIDCNDEILPHFLAEFLNTEIGKIQSNRIANGAVQLNMNLKETGSNLIVVAPKDFQESISALRKRRLLFKELSTKLTDTARHLIEALIEGKLSESDLKDAQEHLEQGDIILDRKILGRLTRRGIDHSNEPLLFPNLDALYAALESLKTPNSINQTNDHTITDESKSLWPSDESVIAFSTPLKAADPPSTYQGTSK